VERGKGTKAKVYVAGEEGGAGSIPAEKGGRKFITHHGNIRTGVDPPVYYSSEKAYRKTKRLRSIYIGNRGKTIQTSNWRDWTSFSH